MNVIAKNSFDRFGDDLTELIVSYLWFEDKVRLECVSKQWRRLIFNKQFVIEIKTKETKNSMIKLIRGKNKFALTIENQLLESLLKKCPNITKFSVDSDVKLSSEANGHMLSLIGQYCHLIKSLEYYPNYDISNEKELTFFRDNGHKLEELDTFIRNDKIKKFYKLCPNMKIFHYSSLFSEDTDFLPKKLELIKLTSGKESLSFNDRQVNRLKIITNKYSHLFKTFNASFDCMTNDSFQTLIDCISHLENLTELTLESGPMAKNMGPIDKCLPVIGQKCTRLLKLDLLFDPLFFDQSVLISDQFFDIFSNFKGIKRLRISLSLEKVLPGNIECFKHCKQLNELHIRYHELREDFFANIASFVPKLQLLRIETRKQYSESFVNLFCAMKFIQNIILTYVNYFEGQTYIWYFGKKLTEVMSSPNAMNVIQVNDNCGLIVHEDRLGLLAGFTNDMSFDIINMIYMT